MGVVIWEFPERWSYNAHRAEYEAAEQAYQGECERLIVAEQDEDEKVVPGRSRPDRAATVEL
jgi:hypothetical protein